MESMDSAKFAGIVSQMGSWLDTNGSHMHKPETITSTIFAEGNLDAKSMLKHIEEVAGAAGKSVVDAACEAYGRRTV